MALLFIDSFDHYATADLPLKWPTSTSAAISSGNGRRSTNSLRFAGPGSAQTGIVPGSTTVTAGFALRTTTLATTSFFILRDGAAGRDHVGAFLNADGSISVYRSGTTLAFSRTSAVTLGTTAPGLITPSVFAYIEIRVTVHDTAGIVVINVNGVNALNLTSQDTAQGSTAISVVGLGYLGSGVTDYDDFYVADSTGSFNNGLLGDVRVDYHVPNANGTYNDSTPSTGTDRSATVDESAPNADTDYNVITSIGNKDSLQMQNLISAGSIIYGIQTIVSAKKTDAANGGFKILTRHAGTDNLSSEFALSTSYNYYKELRETVPGGGSWTESDFNALEIGYQRTL